MKKADWFYRVLEELGDIRFLSPPWEDKNTQKLPDSVPIRYAYEAIPVPVSILGKEWQEVTALEATGEAERWSPDQSQRYWVIN